MSDLFEQYLNAMKRLPIMNPTEADFQSVCPHLTPKQVKRAFIPEEGRGSVYVATPPMRIRHGMLVVNYSTGSEEHKSSLYFAYSHRTLKSYADGESHGDLFFYVTRQKEAMAYADQHWPERLILDTWDCYGEFFVDDPTDLTDRGYPRRKFTVAYTMSRDLNDIINDWSKPQSLQFDDAIIELSIDPFISSELKGGRGGYGDFNCAYCGAGLGLSGCSNCGNEFRDNHSRSGWSTPLPPKVVKLLHDAGHKFGMNPEIAWKAERKYWEEVRVHYK